MLDPNTAESSVKMELNASKTSSAALLNCGNTRGFREKLLLKATASGPPQTERVPRSSVLERLQSFLPQMAEANEKLKRQMEAAPPEHFDIENVEEAPRVIEMDVALVELDGSDCGSEREADDSDSDSDSDDEEDEGEVTENNIRLPGDKKRNAQRNAQIQVLQEEEEK